MVILYFKYYNFVYPVEIFLIGRYLNTIYYQIFDQNLLLLIDLIYWFQF